MGLESQDARRAFGGVKSFSATSPMHAGNDSEASKEMPASLPVLWSAQNMKVIQTIDSDYFPTRSRVVHRTRSGETLPPSGRVSPGRE